MRIEEEMTTTTMMMMMIITDRCDCVCRWCTAVTSRTAGTSKVWAPWSTTGSRPPLSRRSLKWPDVSVRVSVPNHVVCFVCDPVQRSITSTAANSCVLLQWSGRLWDVIIPMQCWKSSGHSQRNHLFWFQWSSRLWEVIISVHCWTKVKRTYQRNHPFLI